MGIQTSFAIPTVFIQSVNMKSSSIVSLAALATSVAATWGKEYTTTTEVYVTYTSLCPVTTTTTEGGKVYTKTYTTTSTVVDHVPTTIVETVDGPDSTAYTNIGVTSTITSLCPITETKTIAGKPVEVIYTSTSLIVEKIPTTIYETTTLLTTCYATEDVYTTLSKFETYYVTISAGSTISVYITETNTVLLTSSYTITKTLEPPTTKATVFVPITLGTSIPVTEVITIPSEITATLPGSSVFTTIPVVTQSTVTAPPITVTPIPTPSPTSSAPLEVSSNAAPTNGPFAFAIVGAMAMIALA